MILELKKIGKIKYANIEINGITVIAGENNSGKSTVGKSLFCIFNSLYHINEKLKNERVDYISSAIFNRFRRFRLNFPSSRLHRILKTEEVSKNIIENKEKYLADKNELYSYLKNILSDKIEEIIKQNIILIVDNLDELIKDISEDIYISLNILDEELIKSIITKILSAEFGMQINNFNDNNRESYFNLKIKDTNISLKIKNDKVENISNFFDIYMEALYIDSPYAADEDYYGDNFNYYGNNSIGKNHRIHLSECVRKERVFFDDNNEIPIKVMEKLVSEKKLESILEKLNTTSHGELIETEDGDFVYVDEDSDKAIRIENLSTGLKTFAIIKKLLFNGYIEDNGTIILDEPEIHLHPEWQIILAELIVLIQKEFKMHILITTHSPYFLRAIEVYSKKHGIEEKCKYYSSEIENAEVIFKDCSGETEFIYEKLGKAFETLEDVNS